MFASLPCHEAQRLTHRDIPIIQQWYCSFTLVGNNMEARPSKFMCLNFVSVVSLQFFYPSWSERCSGSCKLHVSQLCQRTLAKLSVVPMSYCCVWEVGD
ncbi:hypothetical protein ACFXTH_030564 [Malus domestica]